MKIENIQTLPVRPVEYTAADRGTVADTQAKNDADTVSVATSKALQKDARSAEEVRQDVQAINEQLAILNQSLQFSVEAESRDVVVKIVDKESGEVIKQIPPEEIVNLRKRLREMSSLFVEKVV